MIDAGNVRMRTYKIDETAVPTTGWQEVRQGGKFLFEYHAEQQLIRIVRNGRVFVVALSPAMELSR